MPQPKISVIIPAYNEEKIIAACLEGLKHQTFPQSSFEVIVVDNESKDKTAEIAKSYGVKVVYYAEKHTVGAVRNRGVQEAQGQILAFVDADAVPAPNWLEKIDQRFQDPQTMVIAGVGRAKDRQLLSSFLFSIYYAFVYANNLIIKKFLTTGYNIAVRRSIFEQVSGFNPDSKASDDVDLGLRLQKALSGKGLVLDPRVIVYPSTRKFKSLSSSTTYLYRESKNYVNVVLRGKQVSGHLFNVR